ncbi:MAG: hypothetical protein Q7W02_04070 [Candidatus Rokubacteria bacterium]|nr:hypothetical protein [Candidatus Rokubacteria bacterium]
MIGARRIAIALAPAMAAAGCMTGAQTFEQDLAYQRWKRCDTFATIVLQRIDTDGRVIVTGRETEQYQFLNCMAAQAREQQRSKPSLVVPDPIVNPIPR